MCADVAVKPMIAAAHHISVEATDDSMHWAANCPVSPLCRGSITGMRYRGATANDAPAMAELFAANQYGALTEQERADQGFVQGSLDVTRCAPWPRRGSARRG